MKKIFYFAVVALVAMTTSCSQGFDEQDLTPDFGSETLVPMTITVEGEATRTFVGEDGKSICWCEGDKIAVFEGTSTSGDGKTIREFTIVPGSINGKSAVFSGEVSSSATKFYAIYPFESVVERSGSTYFNVDMPAVQQLEGQNNVADGAIVSLAYFTSTDTAVSFKTAVGFLALNITFDDVAKVTVRGVELAGKTKFSKSATTTAEPKVNDVLEVANSVSLLPAGDVFEPGTYYIALLPGTTPAGEFTIDFKRQSGPTTLYVSDKDIVITRNAGFKTTDSKWEKADFGKIGDAQTLVQFLENSASVGDAELSADIDLTDVELPQGNSYLGTLDCKGFALKNWKATKPLFKSLGGAVKNLVIDSSCTLTPANAKGAFGFVAAMVEKTGELENIVNNVASITLNATAYGAGSDQTEDAVYFGTLAGQCYGSIVGCTNNCDVTINTTPVGDDERGLVYIGGVVGLIDGVLDNCHNTGDVAYTIKGRGGFMYMGGVAGGTTTEKLAAATVLKSVVTSCSNTGAISHIYPQNATSIGASNLESNYTYVAGVIGYCEGSVSGCDNGVRNDILKGKVTLTTPTLEKGYVISRTTVAGVAGFALAGGADNTNYAPIVVQGSFGVGNDGTGTYLGGGNSKGVSVAGVIAQTGVSTHFKTKTLNNCHNYGAVDCTFNMASDSDAKTPHYVGGVVANNMVTASTLTNNAPVTVVSYGYEHYLGGVVGNSAADMQSLTNNANLTFTLVRKTGTHLNTANHYLGGVIGVLATGNTLKSATNNNALTYAVNGAPEKSVFFGGVAGSLANGEALTNNGAMTITDSCTDESVVGGIAAKTIGGTVTSLTNNGTISYTGGSLSDLYVGGLVGSGASTAFTNSSNAKAVTVVATEVSNLYLAGVIAKCSAAQTFSELSNSGAVKLDAPSCKISKLYAAGVCALGQNASVFDTCANSGAISLNAASATTAYFGGIGASASATSYALNAVDCTVSGAMSASFAADWYVGGVIAYGYNWSSTTSKQYEIKNNSVTSNISIASASGKLYVGGIVGHSGMHTKYTSNSYKGTISTSSANGFVGGMVGSTVLAATSTNSNDTYYNYTFASNSVDATLSTAGYVGALVGGHYNSTTSAIKSTPIFKYIFDAYKPNTLSAVTNVKEAVSSYRDDARFTVVIEDLEGGVVVK